jgi:hypothetical protein
MRKSFNEAQPCGTCGEISILSCIKCCVPHSARAELTLDFSNDSAIVVTVCCRVDLGFYVVWFALDVMGFWGFSLIIAMNFLALQQHAHAQEDGGPHGKGFQQPTTSTPTTVAPEASVSVVSTATGGGSTSSDPLGPSLGPSTTASQTTTSSSSPSSSPGLGFFTTLWSLPNFGLGQLGNAEFMIAGTAVDVSPFSVPTTGIYVCQTDASNGELPTSQNTWTVGQVPRMCTSPLLGF